MNIADAGRTSISSVIMKAKDIKNEGFRHSLEILMLLNCGAGQDCWESLGLQGDQTSQSWRKSAPNVHWRDWCWSWSSNSLATWCEELTHWKRLKAGGEGDDRGWDGWMASPTWVWASSGSWWWTGRPGVLQSMGSQRVVAMTKWQQNWYTYQLHVCEILQDFP